MKATVIRDFRGAEEALREFRKGDEFEGSEERVAFLAARGFVEPAKVKTARSARRGKRAAE